MKFIVKELVLTLELSSQQHSYLRRGAITSMELTPDQETQVKLICHLCAKSLDNGVVSYDDSRNFYHMGASNLWLYSLCLASNLRKLWVK